MSTIHLICGKICSGKSHYAARLAQRENAVILSCDELSLALFPEGLGTAHDAMMTRAHAYLHDRAMDILRAGTDVILEWGFWKRADRESAGRFYASEGVNVVWHYMDAQDSVLEKRIGLRNRRVLEDGDRSYYVDEGLFKKMDALFEAPDASETGKNWIVVPQENC